MKIYLAGPMRNILNYNFPAFYAAEVKLLELGHKVCNPARVDNERGFDEKGKSTILEMEAAGLTLRDTLAFDLEWICREAEAIVVLPGWENSRGATAEVATARALDIPVHVLDTFTEVAGE
jgi:hypothetical protein